MRTKTVTTNIQPPPAVVTTTTTTKKMYEEDQGDEIGMFGLNQNSTINKNPVGLNSMTGTQNLTAFNQYPAGYSVRENTTFTVPQVVPQGHMTTFTATSQNPAFLGVQDSERLLVTKRGLTPTNQSLSLHP